MSSVVAALDSTTGYQVNIGDNGRTQYEWSTSIKQQIVQLHFQLVRNKTNYGNKSTLWTTTQANNFENIYKNIMLTTGIYDKERHQLLTIMYKLIVFTRDIISGKGECMLSYDLVHRISKYDETMAMKIVHYFVNDVKSNTNMHPYGSWKDIKYMWKYFQWSRKMEDFFIHLVNRQLWTDYCICAYYPDKLLELSLVAKWIPREKSAFKELFYALAEDYYHHYILTANNSASLILAKKKAYGHYRRILSFINKVIDTVQIKQCSHNYSSIDYNKVTSVTHTKQKTAFLNLKKTSSGKTEIRCNTLDRIKAAENYTKYIDTLLKNKKNVKGKRVGITNIVANALERNITDMEKKIIDSQFNDILENLGSLDNFIAMVDTSGSMRGDPLLAAIGLGICVAEKSKLGSRVLTFNRDPTWVNIENKQGLCDKVMTIAQAPWGMNTNFTKALTKILDACVEHKLSNDEVSELVLVVLSDMQIDSQGNEALNEPMWQHIKSLYRSKGYAVIPHILFWNLRFTEGFPVTSEQPGATMFSGFSPSLLSVFSEKGMEAIKDATPWNTLMELLENDRYDAITI